MKRKTPVSSTDLVAILRGVANELAANSRSDSLDHVRVCSDMAKSIRDYLRTITPTS